jgi:hypothetical protein
MLKYLLFSFMFCQALLITAQNANDDIESTIRDLEQTSLRPALDVSINNV